MNKKELDSLLHELKFHPSRKLGQNFLIDSNFLDYIVRAVAPMPEDRILEVGPGFGVLTAELIASGAKVTSIELDRRLCDYLEKNFAQENFTLVRGDACRVDIDTLIAETDGVYRCVANLPYSISGPFISRLVLMEYPPKNVFLMLQKEMADKLCAPPRTKEYGTLSVLVSALYDVKTLRAVPPEVFYPRPEIESAFVEFSMREKTPLPDREDRKELSRFLRVAFSSRRKKALNNIANIYDAAEARSAFESLGIRPEARAEEIDRENFFRLSQKLRLS